MWGVVTFWLAECELWFGGSNGSTSTSETNPVSEPTGGETNGQTGATHTLSGTSAGH